jgi:hypothetical protein
MGALSVSAHQIVFLGQLNQLIFVHILSTFLINGGHRSARLAASSGLFAFTILYPSCHPDGPLNLYVTFHILLAYINCYCYRDDYHHNQTYPSCHDPDQYPESNTNAGKEQDHYHSHQFFHLSSL